MSKITVCIDKLSLADKQRLLGALTLTQPKAQQLAPDVIAKMDDNAVNAALGALDGKCGPRGDRAAATALANAEATAIREIQNGLNKLGLYDKRVDGSISENGPTADALKKLGIPVEFEDGKVKDPAALKTAFDAAVAANVERVKGLETALKGCDPAIQADGVLDAKTRATALEALKLQEANLTKEEKKQPAPNQARLNEIDAKKNDIKAAREDLKDGFISEKTVSTVADAAKDPEIAGKCAARAAATPLRTAAETKAAKRGEETEVSTAEKKPLRPKNNTRSQEADYDDGSRPQARGGRATERRPRQEGTRVASLDRGAGIGGDMQAVGTGRFRSNDAPNHIHSEHTGSRPARRGQAARHDQFEKATEASVGHEKFDAIKRMAAQNRQQGFNGGAIMTNDGYLFPSDVREVETPKGSRYYGRGAARADGGDGQGGGIGGSSGGGRGPGK